MTFSIENLCLMTLLTVEMLSVMCLCVSVWFGQVGNGGQAISQKHTQFQIPLHPVWGRGNIRDT